MQVRFVTLFLALQLGGADPITETITAGVQQQEWDKLNDVLKSYIGQDSPAVGLAPTFVQAYNLMAEPSWVQNICKTGLYGGHTAMLLLLSNPQAKLYTYDEHKQPYTQDVVNFLQSEYPGRFFFSPSSLQNFEQDHPGVQCDLMIAGGPHGVDVPQESPVTAELNLFQKVANPQHHYIVADDTDCNQVWCTPRNNQWIAALQEGQVYAESSVPYYGAAGLSVGVFRPYVVPQQDATANPPVGASFLEIRAHN